jgi:flagellar basal body-associated protein FliL
MAEEQVEATGKQGSSLIWKLAMLAMAVLLPIVLGLVVFRIFLLPALGGAGMGTAEPVVIDPIPLDEVTLRFQMSEESVHTEGEGNSRPVLMYTVVLMCSGQLTADLITSQEDRVLSTIFAIHRNRTRTELSDPAFQDYLAAQVRDELNILLKRLRPDEEHEVRQVSYLKFVILDL